MKTNNKNTNNKLINMPQTQSVSKFLSANKSPKAIFQTFIPK